MNVCWEQSLDTYLRKVENLLMEKEACNNLMLGLLYRFKSEDLQQPYLNLGIVEENGKVIYAFMQTTKHWILPDVADIQKEVIEAISLFLYRNKKQVSSILGPVRLVESFVDQWIQLTGAKANVHMKQLIYQLLEVKVKPASNGILVKATEAEQSLVIDWLLQFGVQAGEHITEEHATETAANNIRNQSLYLWIVNGSPVSMVNNSRSTRNGTSINAVFTPDNYKRNGYATSAVAVLSQKLLDEGYQFCCLYTDLANPTSNGIYQKIGYEVVGDSIVYEFV